MAGINWQLYTERMVGRNHPSLTDTNNRALRQLLTESGYNPDADPFPGLMGPVFNVKAFGAKGDGVTDDTAAIQAALMAAGAFSSGGAEAGGTVVIPHGVYGISNTLTVPDEVRMLGMGRMVTRIVALSTFPASTALVTLGGASEAFDTRMERMTIDCNGVAGTIGVYSTAINISGGLRDIHIRRAQKYGIHLTGNCLTFCLLNVEVTMSTAADANSIGVFLDFVGSPPSLVTAINVIVSASGGTTTARGMRFEGVSGFLSNLHVDQCTSGGILVGSTVACRGMHLAGLDFSGGATPGVQLSNGANPDNYDVVITALHDNDGSIVTLLDDQITGVLIPSAALQRAVGYYSLSGTTGSGIRCADMLWATENITLSAGGNNDRAIHVRTGTLRASANAAGSTITGLATGHERREVRIINVSANTLTLANESGSSTPANRILSGTGADVILGQNDVVILEYDSTSMRWRVMSVVA